MRTCCVGECMVEFRRQDDACWRQDFAGDTLNVAWAMRALLPAAVAVDYVTNVGADEMSEAMLAMMRAAGIGTGGILRDPKRTVGLYTIRTDPGGERSFAYWRSDSAARRLAADPDGLAARLDGAGLIYLSGITLAILPPGGRDALLSVLAARKAGGARIAFDPNIRPSLWEDLPAARSAITRTAALSDMVLPTHDDEARAFGDADAAATLRRYAALGPGEIVVKDGARPTLWRRGAEEGAAPVPAAARVVDTTGAGDSFNGAYLAARLQGAAPGPAVAQAQAVAARVIARPGAIVPAADLRAALDAP